MRRSEILFLDMLLSAREAVEMAKGLTFSSFEGNRTVQLAILKAVETVGEAAARVDTGTREKHPEIPWADITGMRNRLVHEFFSRQLGARLGNGEAGHSRSYLATRSSRPAGVEIAVQTTIGPLIVIPPWEELAPHCRHNPRPKLFDLVEGQGQAGYVVASPDSTAFGDPCVIAEIPLVNPIRGQVGRDA